jgi:hypothetical protein
MTGPERISALREEGHKKVKGLWAPGIGPMVPLQQRQAALDWAEELNLILSPPGESPPVARSP